MPIHPDHDDRALELSNAEARERHRQKMARLTLDSMIQFVGLLDANGAVLEINQVALDAVGLTMDEVEGKPFWTTLWWQVSEEANATLRESIKRAAGGELVRWDTTIYGRAGGKETIIIDASLCPVADDDGVIVFIAAEGRDITEKKAYEREIVRQREELAKLDVLKTQFFANVSHELRTPLTLMLGPLEDALANAHGILPLGAARDLAIAQRNALRLLKLVNAMLDFSRIEAGRLRAFYQPTDLAAFTAELASNFRSLCEKAGLRLIIDCTPADGGEPAYVDHDMWEKVVLNLLSNAFKFTFKGDIEVRLGSDEKTARLVVIDTGVGIPEGELPRVFDRFHRVEHARGRTQEGAGIGLALVKELVQLHGGTIGVSSAVGQGSTFTVTIPLGAAHLDPARVGQASTVLSAAVPPAAFVEEAMRWLPDEAAIEDSLSEATAGRGSPTSLRGATRPRILWADDNADMRAYVARLLRGRFDVEAVSDGEKALHAARSRAPDLILSDVMMPRLDGFGLLRALRADPHLREVPIILVSARAGEESRIEGAEAGADDYLIKPFNARELIARVETHVRMARLRKDASARLVESEDRLRNLMDTAPAMLWIAESDASCTFFSRGWYAYTGQTEEEALGFGWLNAVHPDDRNETRRTLLEAMRKRQELTLDYQLRRADGVYRWVLSSGRPRFDAAGQFAGYTGSVIDVHERQQAVQSSVWLGAVVDACADAIVGMDMEGVIRSWSKGAERLFGHTADEAIGRSITVVIPPERAKEDLEIRGMIHGREQAVQLQTVRVHKDGTRVSVALTVAPLRDTQGQAIGVSQTARQMA